jgi:hypothetical protein
VLPSLPCNDIRMPIRINLLAERQAAEEMRRRDPVKRATIGAGFVLALLAAWGGYLQVRLMGAMRNVNRYETEWKALEKEYNQVTSNLNATATAEKRIAALQSLATNRFLWAPALNALQYAWVDDVQTIRLRTEQTYTQTEGIKPSTNTAGVVSSGKPPTAREKVVLAIEAKDSSSKPGDQILKFQEKINNEPYFKTNLEKSELTGRTPVQTDPATLRPFVQFTVECQFPEKRR